MHTLKIPPPHIQLIFTVGKFSTLSLGEELTLPVMIVIMTINEKIIESRFVPNKNLLIEGYVEGLQRDMLEQIEDIIDLREEKPKFHFQEWPVKKPDLN